MRAYKAPPASTIDAGTMTRLKDEIATLERRLQQIGPDGDCGYEKAMIRFFREQIEKRRRQLGMTPVAG